MTIITIYDAEKAGPPSFTQTGDLWLSTAQIEYKTHAGIIWTEKDGGMEDDPTTLTVNTMSRQFIFSVPRLVFFNNRVQVLSALSGGNASGTLQAIKKYYILVETQCDT